MNYVARRRKQGTPKGVYRYEMQVVCPNDRDTNSYNLSSSMRKLIELISVNSGKPLTDDAEGNPEPNPFWGRCNDYPVEEYIRSLMEARNTQT